MRRDFTKATLGVFIALGLLFSFNNSATAQNGSLYLSPSSGQVAVGQIFSLVLRVNTGGTAINAAEGSIVFDQAKLSVASVSKSGSVFTIWAEEPKFSNAEGTIEFAGGLPNPGYSGSNGLVLTINFRTKTATTVRGTTDITLVSGGILANDGYGTNILSSLGKATYTISPGVITPAPTVPTVASEKPTVAVPDLLKIDITSSTHPDSSKWYSGNSPLFKWKVPSGVSEVILVLSKRANSPPIINYSPPISEKLLTDIEEGEWYLNGRFRTEAGLGPVTSFKFNIDTQPPSDFTVTRLDTADSTNPRPELLFESSDATSGVDYYVLAVNGGEPVKIEASETGKSYAMPLQIPGEKNLEIKAFDKAGNSAVANLTIQVESIEIPRIDAVSPKTREGKKLEVNGVAKPDQMILIYASGKVEKVYETTADTDGKFAFAITDLPAGKYKINAKAKDERGAISDPSNDMSAEVIGRFWGLVLDFIFKVFDWFVRILSGGALFIAFLAVLVGLIISLIKLFENQIKEWWHVINKRRKVKSGNKKSARTLAHIRSDLKKELDILHEISKNRKLTLKERFLKSKLEQDLKNLNSPRLVD